MQNFADLSFGSSDGLDAAADFEAARAAESAHRARMMATSKSGEKLGGGGGVRLGAGVAAGYEEEEEESPKRQTIAVALPMAPAAAPAARELSLPTSSSFGPSRLPDPATRAAASSNDPERELFRSSSREQIDEYDPYHLGDSYGSMGDEDDMGESGACYDSNPSPPKTILGGCGAATGGGAAVAAGGAAAATAPRATAGSSSLAAAAAPPAAAVAHSSSSPPSPPRDAAEAERTDGRVCDGGRWASSPRRAHESSQGGGGGEEEGGGGSSVLLARARAGVGFAGRKLAGEVLMSVEDLFGSSDEDDAAGGTAGGDGGAGGDGPAGGRGGSGGGGSREPAEHRSEHANVRDASARLRWPPTAADYRRDASELFEESFDDYLRTSERPRTAAERLRRAGQAPDARLYYDQQLEEHLTHLVLMMTLEAAATGRA